MTQITSQFRVVSQSSVKPNLGVQNVALFDVNGNPLIVVQTTQSLLLTGYTAGTSTAALAATDTVLEALAKLANRLDDHQTRITTLEGT